MNEAELLTTARAALDARLDDAAVLRLQGALDHELHRQSQPVPPIMTVTEVATYLRVTQELVGDLLGDLPAFELGGRLLFRKEAVDAWIRQREKKLTYEILEFDLKHELVPAFTGTPLGRA